MDNKYKNGKIYKLVCDATPIVYYGSTIVSLAQRLSDHKYKRTSMSRELFDMGNVSIHLIEEYPCNSKKELESRERIYIEFMLKNFKHKIICNKCIPTRTPAEYRQDNNYKEQQKEYYQDNKDKIKENYKYNKEKCKEFYQENRDKLNNKCKQYYFENIEFKQKYNKTYYEKNKEKLKERNSKNVEERKKKIKCECGSVISNAHKSNHLKSKKHLAYLSAKNK